MDNFYFIFDLLIGTSFILGLFLSLKIHKYLKTQYSDKFDVKKLFVPKYKDKKYILLINWLRVLTIIMVASIWGKAILFVMNK